MPQILDYKPGRYLGLTINRHYHNQMDKLRIT